MGRPSCILVGLLVGLTLNLRAAEPACPELHAGFSSGVVDSDVPFEGILSGPSGPGVMEREVPLGERGEARVAVAIVSQLEGPDQTGVQGWSLAIEVDGDLDILDATVEGTPGGGDTMFEIVRAIDPERNDGRRGILSTVVRTHHLYLPLVGTRSVLDMTVGSLRPQGRDEISGSLALADELMGEAAAVLTRIVERGEDRVPCDLDAARLEVRFRRSPDCFIRGDANEDGRVNIADPIWTLTELFRAGPVTERREAADSDGDGAVRISDAVYTLHYQLLGGPPPPPPFPECGEAPAG